MPVQTNDFAGHMKPQNKYHYMVIHIDYYDMYQNLQKCVYTSQLVYVKD